jgi:hypothetical protein
MRSRFPQCWRYDGNASRDRGRCYSRDRKTLLRTGIDLRQNLVRVSGRSRIQRRKISQLWRVMIRCSGWKRLVEHSSCSLICLAHVLLVSREVSSSVALLERAVHDVPSPIYRGVGIEDPLLRNGIASEGSRGEILSVDRFPHCSRLTSPVQMCSFRIYADLPLQSCNCPCLVDRAIVGETLDRFCEVEGS